jgi:MerR family transcriptional regulator/heat shock protein HspR
MRAIKYELTVTRPRRDLMALEEVAARFDIHPDILRRFINAGLIEPAEVSGQTIMFEPRDIKRVRAIQRLRRDLGINLAGIAVIFNLLDRLSATQYGGGNGH